MDHLGTILLLFAAITDSTVPVSWWTDDRIIAFVGIGISSAAFLVGLWIAQKQHESQKLFSQKVLGSIPGVDQFLDRLCEVLKQANDEPRAHVAIMVYWLWFGADRQFPRNSVDSITETSSEVMRLLKMRVSGGLPTTVVFYDTTDCAVKLRAFFHEILRYNSETAHRQIGSERKDVSEEDIKSLFKRYEQSVAQIQNLASVYDDDVITLKGIEEIPALMCSVTGREPTGFVLLFEHSAIRGLVSAGGFESHEPHMVDTIREQIRASAGRTLG